MFTYNWLDFSPSYQTCSQTPRYFVNSVIPSICQPFLTFLIHLALPSVFGKCSTGGSIFGQVRRWKDAHCIFSGPYLRAWDLSQFLRFQTTGNSKGIFLYQPIYLISNLGNSIARAFRLLLLFSRTGMFEISNIGRAIYSG